MFTKVCYLELLFLQDCLYLLFNVYLVVNDSKIFSKYRSLALPNNLDYFTVETYFTVGLTFMILCDQNSLKHIIQAWSDCLKETKF